MFRSNLKPMHWRFLTGTVAVVVAVTAGYLVRYLTKEQPRELIRQARSAQLRGDIEGAKQIVDRILRQVPHHAESNLLRCDLALQEGDYNFALDCLARIGDRPAATAARARFREGLVFLQLGRAAEAEARFLKSCSLDPTAHDAESKLRELYMLELRREDFRALLRSRRATRPWSLADLLDFIVVGHVPRFLAGNWNERIEALTRIDPDDIQSQLALAIYHAAMGRHQDSAEVARSLLEKTPHHPMATAILAEGLIELGKVEEAESLLEQVPAEIRTHPWILRSQGRAAFVSGQYQLAAEKLRDSLRLEPGNPSVIYQLGLCLERVGATTEAAVRVRSGSELGSVVDRAQQILKQSQLDRDPRETTKLVLDLAELLAECDLWEDAQYCCEFVLRYDPRNGKATELHARTLPKLLERGDSTRLTSTTCPVHKSERDTASQSHRAPLPIAVRSASPLFEEVSSKLGLSFEYFTGQTGNKYLIETLGGGVAAFDYDGDGWPDLYFPQGSRFPPDSQDLTHRDLLARNARGEAFVDVTEAAGLGDLNFSIGCAAGDWDNDGFADLLVANYGRNRAYHNNGDGTLSDVSQELGLDAQGMNTSLALADLDQDGDLDLYVVNYLASIDVCRDRRGEVFACHPSMFQAEQDLLFENQGNGRFLDVTAESGVKAPDGKGLGIVVADLDNDTWPDIYIANDSTPNFLFRNLGRRVSGEAKSSLRFEECALASGAAVSRNGQARAGMGIACADFDGNGFLDLYVTNYYLEANALFLNQGRMTFVDSVRPASLVADTTPLLGFGTQALDADLDGHLDLFVANGHVDDYRRQDPNVMWKMPPKLYLGSGNLEFEDVSSSAGAYFQGEYLGRGVMRLDWNRDGRPDLVVVHQNERAVMLENATATAFHRVVLALVGTSSNRDGLNTRFWVTTGPDRRMQEVTGGDGYLASNERRQVIGLGERATIDKLEILWPSGRQDLYSSLPANSHILIIEGREPTIRPLR